MRNFSALSIVGLLLAGCAGGVGGSVTSNTDEPASCKEGGDPMQCYQDMQRKTQAETGMTPQQQQMFMQQMMQGGSGMAPPGMMPQGQMPVMQPGAMPGMAPSGSAPRQPGEMTPQEEQEFLKKIEKLQQQQQSTTPAK